MTDGPDRPDVQITNFSVELLDWWHQIENKMCDHVYDSKSRQMLDTLENEKEYAKNILEAVDSALVALNHLNQGQAINRILKNIFQNYLSKLRRESSAKFGKCLNFEPNKEYVSVRQKTCALHNACETLLHEQTRLTDNAEAIHEKLSYFQELDSIKSRLKNPNLEVNSGLVKSAQFV